MPNFIEIGGVTRKPLVDLTWNDPILMFGRYVGNRLDFAIDIFGPAASKTCHRSSIHRDRCRCEVLSVTVEELRGQCVAIELENCSVTFTTLGITTTRHTDPVV